MKKTVTVNLDKTIFNIDDDAYTVLESYLEALHDHFKKEEGGQEIMNDIESRISELFKERLGFGMQVITLQEVNEVIAIMGQPDEIENPLDSGTAPDNNADGDNSGQTTDTSNNESHKSTKRLYRDPDNRILGGVASGMGYYFGYRHGSHSRHHGIAVTLMGFIGMDISVTLDMYSRSPHDLSKTRNAR